MLTGCQSAPKDRNEWLEQVVEGFWSWSLSPSHCDEDWHTITYGQDEKRLYFESNNAFEQGDGTVSSEYEYKILSILPYGYHLSLTNETRKDETGQLVTWFLIFRDANTYFWRRSDWKENHGTKNVDRC
jgi:hypothetical protein